DLDAVAARRPEHDLELAGVLAGLLDRVVEIELFQRALATEPAQVAQRHVDLANVEHDVAPVLLEHPLIRDGHRAAPATTADAHAGRVRPARAKWRRAAGADPAVALVVALFLLLEALLELGAQLLEVELTERLALLLGQALERLRVHQPLLQL